jgi:DNA-binding NarL/FixJ family response regulator
VEKPAPPTRIVLVDDHDIVRDGIRLRLHQFPDLKIVGEAEETEAGWELVSALKPDLVIMDLILPGRGGLVLTQRIRDALPGTKVMILSARAEAKAVNDTLRAGACGYLLKTEAGAAIVDAVRSVLAGQVYLCPSSAAVIAAEYQRSLQGNYRPGGILTARETEVLKRIADGQTTKEIASSLELSPKTVETHRVNLMAKLGVNGVAALTRYALREGITEL